MTDIDQLSAEMKQLLRRYGFDRRRFAELRAQVVAGTLSQASNIVEGRLEPPESDAWIELARRDSEEAVDAVEAGRAAIRAGRVGMIILNGGMATRFGGVVKGIVQALPGRSFLSLKVQNVLDEAHAVGGRVRVFLMNSFATDDATRAHFAENRNFGLPEEDLTFFAQGIRPRLTPSGELFLDKEGNASCYGPGHGDCPVFFRRSGCLAEFLDGDGEYLLISNVDNLAARLDPQVIGRHILSKKDLTAEVAPKWPGDQGGAPVYVNDRLWVVEGFRFPPDFDQDQVPVFNTNTFTVTARALGRNFRLTPCFVQKDIEGKPAVQIETLIGELTRFLSTNYIKVKRAGAESRFFPIKTPQDLEDGLEDLQLICG